MATALLVLFVVMALFGALAWALRRSEQAGGRLAPVERAIERGDWRTAGAIADDELARGASGLPGAEAYLHYAAGRAALLGRELDAAIEHLDQALFLVSAPPARDPGVAADVVEYLPGFEADCRCFLGLAVLQRGDLHTARAVLDSVVNDAEYNGDRWSIRRHLAVIARVQGRLTDARIDLDEALTASIDADDTAASAEALRGLGQIDEQEGDLTGAAACYLRALEEFRRLGRESPGRANDGHVADETVTLLLLARVLAAAGAREEATKRLAEARALAPDEFVDMASHVAFFGSGVARHLGQSEEAARLAVEARAGYADCQMSLMAEYATRERARALVKLGALDDARLVLATSAAGFDRCGATLDAEITRSELADLGPG